jgi:hypothetical protein
LSVRIDSVFNAVSIVSQAVSALSQANSAGHVSLQTLISALSADVSVRLSAISQAHSALSNQNSVDHVSINARIDTQSQAISVISQQVSVLSQALSALTSAHNALSNTVSGIVAGANSITSAEYLSLVNRVSANSGTGGAASVTSNELSAVSAWAASALSVISNTISDDRSAGDAAISNILSAINDISAGLGAPQMRMMSSGNQSVSGTTPTYNNLSGMSISLAAGGYYEYWGHVWYTCSTSGGAAFGLSVPALTRHHGIAIGDVSTAATSIPANHIWSYNHTSSTSGSVIFSVGLASGAGGTGVRGMQFKGMLIVSTAGTLQVALKTSAAAPIVTVLEGSFVRAFRLK